MAALPNVVVIGAMKCATTALHHYLDAHPQVGMCAMKETNFFTCEWDRPLDWYTSLFDDGAPVRGETSPGYTSPDHALAPGRMARVLPGARLLYLVRDPVDRAVSQYEHHAREGAERRTLAEAVLDPDSQYVSRGRYLQRLEPFLHRFSGDRVQVVVQERLRDYRRRELRRV